MKIRNKGLLVLLMLFLIMTLLFACGKKDGEETGKAQNSAGKEVNVTPQVPEETITEGAKDQASQGNETADRKEIRDIPSVELVKEIVIGWNLGNTLDATGRGNTLDSEISWGNPLTTKEMITMVKEAGFRTLRVPTSWGKHLGEAPDYKIDPAWLDRVQEVVDYGIENDMYVILNMHHEEWHFPSYDNLEQAKAILTSVWTQIADRFQDYDEHLIFEGMNEPRMKGTELEWTGGNKESRDVINQLNAAFFETIRKSPGNNPLRHLMIPCYAASANPNTWVDFIVPEDDKVIVSIHAYTPYPFTLDKSGSPEWSIDNAKDTSEIDSLMNNIYTYFVSKGQPVILGEFGAMNKDNLEARVAWAEYYIKKATENGIPCIWWDNGAIYGTGELFGILNRRNLKWEFPEIVEALMKGLN